MVAGDISGELTHLSPMFHFYTPEKRQKTKGLEMENWSKMD